jgi:hypothetical protein
VPRPAQQDCVYVNPKLMFCGPLWVIAGLRPQPDAAGHARNQDSRGRHTCLHGTRHVWEAVENLTDRIRYFGMHAPALAAVLQPGAD